LAYSFILAKLLQYITPGVTLNTASDYWAIGQLSDCYRADYHGLSGSAHCSFTLFLLSGCKSKNVLKQTLLLFCSFKHRMQVAGCIAYLVPMTKLPTLAL